MPTKVQVKVNTVNHTSQTSQAGNDLNYVEITGYDATNSKGFKKRFFATKKDGSATKNAETADALVQDDWVEFTLDDTSYHNVQTLKKIAEPAGMSAPSQSSPQSGNPKGSGGGGGGKKNYSNPKKEASIARSVALKASVEWTRGDQESDVSTVLSIAKQFEGYLNPVEEEKKDVAPNGNTFVNAPPGSADQPPVQDDDIPF